MRNDIQQDPLFILGNKLDNTFANFVIKRPDKQNREKSEYFFIIRLCCAICYIHSYVLTSVFITVRRILIKFSYYKIIVKQPKVFLHVLVTKRI